jgi:hypothetical protein
MQAITEDGHAVRYDQLQRAMNLRGTKEVQAAIGSRIASFGSDVAAGHVPSELTDQRVTVRLNQLPASRDGAGVDLGLVGDTVAADPTRASRRSVYESPNPHDGRGAGFDAPYVDPRRIVRNMRKILMKAPPSVRGVVGMEGDSSGLRDIEHRSNRAGKAHNHLNTRAVSYAMLIGGTDGYGRAQVGEWDHQVHRSHT